MNLPSIPTSNQSPATKPSLAFRLSSAVLVGLLAMVLYGHLSITAFAGAITAAFCVFILSDILLSFLILAIPPGLLVLALAGLLAR
jgi:hypothetical protein